MCKSEWSINKTLKPDASFHVKCGTLIDIALESPSSIASSWLIEWSFTYKRRIYCLYPAVTSYHWIGRIFLPLHFNVHGRFFSIPQSQLLPLGNSVYMTQEISFLRSTVSSKGPNLHDTGHWFYKISSKNRKKSKNDNSPPPFDQSRHCQVL